MLKRIKTLFMWLAVIIGLLVAWKAYDEYRFVQITNRAMEQLGETEKPDVVIDQDGTLRGDGYVIDMKAVEPKLSDPKVGELD